MTGQSRSVVLLAVALIVQPVPALARGASAMLTRPGIENTSTALPEEVQRAARRLCPKNHTQRITSRPIPKTPSSSTCTLSISAAKPIGICAMRRAACIRFTSCAADTISSFVVFMDRPTIKRLGPRTFLAPRFHRAIIGPMTGELIAIGDHVSRIRRGRWICSSLNIRDFRGLNSRAPYSRRIRWSTD